MVLTHHGSLLYKQCIMPIGRDKQCKYNTPPIECCLLRMVFGITSLNFLFGLLHSSVHGLSIGSTHAPFRGILTPKSEAMVREIQTKAIST